MDLDVTKFLPTEEAIRTMHRRYPRESTFIMDTMMTEKNSAGWFLAGYLFGIDLELREAFAASREAVASGGVGRKHDA